MKLSEKQKEMIFNLPYSSTSYNKSFEMNKMKYHYKNSSLFEAQLNHVLSLILNELEVKNVQYEYVTKENENNLGIDVISYCNKIQKDNEELIENISFFTNYYKEYSYINVFETVKKFIIERNPKMLNEFYKQYVISVLIGDYDKNNAIIKNENDEYIYGPYYDFGLVFGFQHEEQVTQELQVDAYYDERTKELLFEDIPEYNEEILSKEFQTILNRMLRYIKMDDNDINRRRDYTYVLKECLENVDEDFINKCLNFNILEIMNKDTENSYSKSSRLAILSMIELRKDNFKKLLNEINKKQSLK